MSTEHPPLFVLVVEDLDDAAQSTSELLTLCGHTVRVTGCCNDALRAVADEMPDVILLDIGLPDANGWQVAARIRERARGKQPFIVAVTGFGTEADKWRSADSGIDLHLVKPVDPQSLIRLLARVREALATRYATTSEGRP